MKQISFYFDFLSPYSYLGFELLKQNAEDLKRDGVEVLYIPVILSKVIKSYGTLGPAEIKPKREFLMRDCLRFAKKKQIKFVPPKLPFNSLLPLKLCLCSNSSEQLDLIDYYFSKAWKEGLDISNEELLKEWIKDDIKAQEMIEQALSKEKRIKLNENLKEALERGVFGLPSFYCQKDENEELFWGKDSIEDVISFFKGTTYLDPKEYEFFLSRYQVSD